MTRKTPTAKKKPEGPKVVAYRVDAVAFTNAIAVMAELPYNRVGNLINELRSSKEILEEKDSG